MNEYALPVITIVGSLLGIGYLLFSLPKFDWSIPSLDQESRKALGQFGSGLCWIFRKLTKGIVVGLVCALFLCPFGLNLVSGGFVVCIVGAAYVPESWFPS